MSALFATDFAMPRHAPSAIHRYSDMSRDMPPSRCAARQRLFSIRRAGYYFSPMPAMNIIAHPRYHSFADLPLFADGAALCYAQLTICASA